MIILFLCEKDGAKTEALLQRAAVLFGNKKGTIPADLTVERTDMGKPFFINERRIKFSVSHSENLWACLMADTEVGLDVQYMRDVDFGKIAERFFTEQEQEYVKHNGREGFYHVWCRKEAIVKYYGETLPAGFSKYDTILLEDKGISGVRLFVRDVNTVPNAKCVCVTESPEEIEIIWM